MTDCMQAEGTDRRYDELVDEHEIVLHRFLVELAKIGPRNGNETIEEFEDEGCICITPAVFVGFTLTLKDGWDALDDC